MPIAIEEETRLAPHSLVIRHQPMSKTQRSGYVQVARASQLTKTRSQPVSATNAAQKEYQPPLAQTITRKRRGSWRLPLGIGMLCTLLLAIGGQFLVEWGTTSLSYQGERLLSLMKTITLPPKKSFNSSLKTAKRIETCGSPLPRWRKDMGGWSASHHYQPRSQ